MSHVVVRDRGAVIRVQWTHTDAAEWERLFAGERARTSPPPCRRALPQRLTTQLMNEAQVPLDRKGAELRRGERIALDRTADVVSDCR